ncbi:MAG: hypothetical protein Kow00107_00680 [Planctomycetota bacterium]
MSSTIRTIKLTILDTRECNCYMPGETVVIRYPEIVKRETDRICVNFVKNIVPLLDALLEGRKPEEYKMVEEDTWLVKCHNNTCKLLVHVLLDADLNRTDRIASLDSARLMEELSTLQMFRSIDPQVVYDIAGRAKVTSFPAGETIVKKGEIGRHLYIILTGTASVLGTHDDGSESVIAVLKRGDSIGEMSLLTQENISATVVAQENCTAARLSRMDFINLLTRHPTFNLYYSRLLAARLRSTNQQFISLLEQGVTGKLSTVSLHELVQILKLNSRSGMLKLFRGSKQGTLYFKQGLLVHAECGKLTGEDAFYDMVMWRTGEFRFESGTVDVDRSIHTDAMALILEAMRRQDEGSR